MKNSIRKKFCVAVYTLAAFNLAFGFSNRNWGSAVGDAPPSAEKME